MVPVPDPTLLTTEQLIRSMAALREILEARLDGTDKIIDQIKHEQSLMTALIDSKISAMHALHEEKFRAVSMQFAERDAREDRNIDEQRAAVKLALDAARDAKESIMAQTTHLQELHDEKFRSISVQFAERDTRTEQTSRDSKVAVDAALTAQKEAVAEQNRSNGLAIAKSETATAKQIDQHSVLLQTSAAALNDKIDDVKQRLTKIEGSDIGSAAAKTQNNWLFGVMISAALVIGSTLIAAVIAYALRK